MLLLKAVTLVFACTLPTVMAAPAPASGNSTAEVKPNSYIIQLKPNIDLTKHLSWVKEIHGRNTKSGIPGLKGFEKEFGFDGFRAYSGEFDPITIELIKTSLDVISVETTKIFNPPLLHDFQQRALVARGFAPWGIQMATQRPKPKDNTAWTDETAGQGTWVYHMDSGVRATHQDFQGRYVNAWTAYPDKPNTDTIGHGTYTGGIIGARTFGFSLKTNVVSVKIFDNGGAGADQIMPGYAWAVNDIKSKGRVGKAVIHFCADGGFSQATNDAIKAAYDQGILTIAPSGNAGVDVSTRSPGSAPEAVTVGAVDVYYKRADFSAYGPLVDTHAPGVNVISTGFKADDDVVTASGTSASGPHVAGLAVYFIALAGKALQPIEIVNRIVYCATYDYLTNIPSGTKNSLLYNCSGK